MLFVIPNRAKTTTETNLAACFPQKSDKELSTLTKKSLISTANTALEMGKSWLLPMKTTLNLITECEGQEAFEEAYANGDGVILLAPHLGNWEIFAFYLCDAIESTWLYQPPKNPALDKLIARTRSRNGIALAPTNQAGVARLFRALKQGQAIGVLPDQVPSQESGDYAPFFGVPAFTMTLVTKLVQKTNAKVFCGFAQRLPNSQGFKVIVEEADRDIYSGDFDISLAALNKTVEKSALKAIEQYQWEYKRFRNQADGKKFY